LRVVFAEKKVIFSFFTPVFWTAWTAWTVTYIAGGVLDLRAPAAEMAEGAIKWFGLSRPSNVSKEMAD